MCIPSVATFKPLVDKLVIACCNVNYSTPEMETRTRADILTLMAKMWQHFAHTAETNVWHIIHSILKSLQNSGPKSRNPSLV